MKMQSSQATIALVSRWMLGHVACSKLGQHWPGRGGDYGWVSPSSLEYGSL